MKPSQSRPLGPGPLLFLVLAAAGLVAAPPLAGRSAAQGGTGARRIQALETADLRQWDTAVDRMNREGTLQLRQRRDDPMADGRTHERFDQFYRGVRVVGGDIARQLDGSLTTSIFGTVYEGLSLNTTPDVTAATARETIATLSGVELPETYEPELVVLPLEGGGFALAYSGRAFGAEGLFRYYIDAHSGQLLLSLSDLKSQVSAVGTGAGVLGDTKKMSTNKVTGGYRTEDELRPPTLVTFDMKGNLTRTLNFLNGVTSLTTSDIASDSDNTWSDPAIVDAHAYAGYVYDYYFKRFGRRGLDGSNSRILAIVHPVDRNAVRAQTSSVVGLFYLNAFYAGGGVMVFGEGLPPGLTAGGQSWNYLSGALDVFAHELTHGVTDFSSQLIYQGESGALNEAFSDIIGTSCEAFHQPQGNGPLRSDYLMGEDVITPGGIRSAANPAAFGDPDHYSLRYTGTQDNGGVHTNSLIATHAFYLAVEGGTNRTSGLSVTGVGFANREQIEKVYYRAFTQMMPSNATFAVARAVTIQAATDLYGASSAATRAITQAWTAVGVN